MVPHKHLENTSLSCILLQFKKLEIKELSKGKAIWKLDKFETWIIGRGME